MSDTSWSLSAPRGGTAGRRALSRSPGTGGLLDPVVALLYGWLPGQRWFAGKGRPVADITVLSATELAAPSHGSPGLLHLLVRVDHVAPGTPLTAHPSPPGDCYQLLLGTRSTLPPALAPALVGRVDGGPHDGTIVYDAPHDPLLAGLLMEYLAASGPVETLRFHRAPDTALPLRLPPRVGTAEQSNTSVVYGDALILKLFRRISPGTNPDLELTLALSAAGCHRVPAPAAWFDIPWPGAGEGAGEPTTLGLLQRFLPGSADGWELALASVPGGPGRTAGDGGFTGESYLLGRATAEVHRVLAAELPGGVLDREGIDRLAEGMAARLDAAADAVPGLKEYRAPLRGAFHDLSALGRSGRTLRVQRIHGDLHLGQAMRTTDGWVLLDFEGEPARPLAERRRPQPAVRDVAAMLRSFDYAARYHLVAPDGPEPGPGAAGLWAERNRAAFRAGYAAVASTGPAAARDTEEERVLTRAFETDKAVYEVLYEARHRPAWLPVPLSAIERLAAPTRRGEPT